MRKILKEKREKVAVMVGDQAVVVERDTYKVIVFVLDLINERCNCVVARSYTHPETGLLTWEDRKWEVIEMSNDKGPNIQQLSFYQFLADMSGTGNIDHISGDMVLDWVIDHAEELKADIWAEPRDI